MLAPQILSQAAAATNVEAAGCLPAILDHLSRGVTEREDQALPSTRRASIITFGATAAWKNSSNMCRASLLWSFESKDASSALAQRNIFIERLRRHRGISLDLDSAKLIFTELVTNVMRHAGDSIRITLECSGDRVLLRIVDSGPGFDYDPRLPNDPFSEGGRGLFLVSKVAPEVRVEHHDSITSVLAVLPNKQT